jgi:RNA-dependent RNA polymerase
MKDGLRKRVEPLLEWDAPDAMAKLWAFIYQRVKQKRSARQNAGMARVNGYYERDMEELGDDDNEDDLANLDYREERSVAGFPDETSGCPATLEEAVRLLFPWLLS